MLPDEPNEEEKQEKLPEDGQTPFGPPRPIGDDSSDDNRAARIDNTHPDTDDGLDSDEVYQEGYPSAAGATEPNAGNAVRGYHKPGSTDDDEEEE